MRESQAARRQKTDPSPKVYLVCTGLKRYKDVTVLHKPTKEDRDLCPLKLVQVTFVRNVCEGESVCTDMC